MKKVTLEDVECDMINDVLNYIYKKSQHYKVLH